MSSLERLNAMIGRTNRVLVAAGVVLTIVSGGVLVGSAAGFPGAAIGTEEMRTVSAPSGTLEPISEAKVRKVSTGKAIFRTSRVEKTKVVDELSHYVLRGISSRNGIMKAYMGDTKLKKLHVKTVGESVGPYEIVNITAEGVTLRRGAEEVFLPKG